MSNGPSNGISNGEKRLSRAGACARPVPSRPKPEDLEVRYVDLGPFARTAAGQFR